MLASHMSYKQNCEVHVARIYRQINPFVHTWLKLYYNVSVNLLVDPSFGVALPLDGILGCAYQTKSD